MIVEPGDIVWYPVTVRRKGVRVHEIEWGVVSSYSSLTPSLVFTRNARGRARCVKVADITRVQSKGTSDATAGRSVL